MDDLRARHCTEKPKGSPALSPSAAENLRNQLHPEWHLAELEEAGAG